MATARNQDLNNLMKQRDTIEAQTLPAGGHVETPKIAGVNSTRERLPAGRDKFYVSPETRSKMGVPDTHEIVFSRCDDWQKLGFDRPQEVLDDNEGSFIPMKPNGTAYRNGDLIYVARPKEVAAEIEAREKDALLAYKAEQDEDVMYDRMRGPDGEVVSTEMQQAAIRNMNARAFKEMSRNSSTAGMSLEAASSRYTKEQIQEQEMHAVLRGREGTVSREQFEEARAKTMEKMRNEGRRGNSFAMGASFDKQGNLVR